MKSVWFALAVVLCTGLAIAGRDGAGDARRTEDIAAETREAQVAPAVVDDLVAQANRFQKGSVRDRVVTDAEYAAAVEAMIVCVKTVVPSVQVSGPTRRDGTKLLDVAFRADLINAALPGVVKDCNAAHVRTVEELYSIQQIPNDDERTVMLESFRTCLERTGSPVADDATLLDMANAYQATAIFEECAALHPGLFVAVREELGK